MSGFVAADQMDQDHLEMERPVHQGNQSLTDVRACGAARMRDGWRWLASDVNNSLVVPVVEWSTQQHGRVLVAHKKADGQAAGGVQVVS